MPPKGKVGNGKGKKRRLASPAVNTRQPKRARVGPMGGSGGLTAPLAVSRTRKLTYGYSSLMVSGKPVLRVNACVPICEIGNDPHNNGLFFQSTVDGGIAVSAVSPSIYNIERMVQNGATSPTDASPAEGQWISPHVPLLSLAFDRYIMRKLVFHYEPQAAATVGDRMVFAWTDDPTHPFLSTDGAIFSNTNVSQLAQLVTKDSVAFMPWKEWSLEVPVSEDERFMYNGGGDTSMAETRWTAFGSLSCVGSLAPTLTQYGILYASLVVDLLDPVPIVQIGDVINTIKRKVYQHHARRPRAKMEEKKAPAAPPSVTSVTSDGLVRLTLESDLDDPSPPRYRPPPGGSALTPAVSKVPSRKS